MFLAGCIRPTFRRSLLGPVLAHLRPNSNKPTTPPPSLACQTTQANPLDGTTDELGLPLKPTWSVHALLSSYPRPSLSPEQLKRLHTLSALKPPEEGSAEWVKLKEELEELVRLVEAVKLIEVDEGEEGSIPDARIWPAGTGIERREANLRGEEEDGERGRALLKYAKKTEDGFYVVETERPRPASR